MVRINAPKKRVNTRKKDDSIKVTNPFPIGSQKYKEFEKDVKWLNSHKDSIKIDEYGNRIIYKTSGFQRVVIILMILIFLAICGS